MKQSLRKIFGAASAVFLIGLFVLTAPVGAASTDERIKALEAELQALKTEQQKVQTEQSVMKDEALAAAAKLPDFRYRAGRGLTVRGADRSWQITFGAKFQTQLSFFPGGAASLRDDSEDGPSNGGMIFRHAETDFYYRLFGGLYEFGLTQDWTAPRAKTEIMQIRFSDWSPYYPDLRILAVSPGTYSPYTRVSSTSGMSMERDPTFDAQYSTGSSKGMAFQWGDVPVGPVNIDTLSINYLSGDIAYDSKYARDPTNQKGVIFGIVVDPLAKNKNMYLKGLKMGFTYLQASDDDERNAGGSTLRSRTRGRNNQTTIFYINTRGQRMFVEPWIQWVAGPWELGYTWGRHVGSQQRSNTGDGNFSDARATINTINAGVFVWGPKGFLSGSRNGGWKFTYTHNRSYFDAGSGSYDAATRAASSTGNEFAMRRWHYIENIMMLRWYQSRNMTYALEYQINLLDKMEGGGTAAEARQRLGVAATGGTYQIITLNALWEF